VYGSDWDYKPITVPPEEAQFVETMKMTTNQIAAVYGIPPEMIGGESGSSMTYANVEQQQINFVMFTLRPWLVRLETAFSALLPDRQYVKFNSDALIRADLKTRWEVNQIRVNLGAASLDEIRAQEDEPSFAFRVIGDGGDEWGLTDQNFPQRTLLDLDLHDVAPVNAPAYLDTNTAVRSLAKHVHADESEVRRLATEGELRKFFVRTDKDGGGQRKHDFGAAARMQLLGRRSDPWA
jgi:hypothetical protein